MCLWIRNCATTSLKRSNPRGTQDFNWWGWSNGRKKPRPNLDQTLAPKKSHAKFLTLKISNIKNIINTLVRHPRTLPLIVLYSQNYAAKVSYPPKNPFLNQATNKNSCQFFSYTHTHTHTHTHKKQNQNFQTPKKSFYHPHHMKSRLPWGSNKVNKVNQSGPTSVITPGSHCFPLVPWGFKIVFLWYKIIPIRNNMICTTLSIDCNYQYLLLCLFSF